MLPLCSRDPCLALRGFWTSGKAPVQATPSLTVEWRFLACGAAAGSGAAPLAGPIGAEAPRDTLFKVGVCHVKISTSYGVLLYPIFGGGARVGWLGRMAHGGRMTPPHLFYKRSLNCSSSGFLEPLGI